MIIELHLIPEYDREVLSRYLPALGGAILVTEDALASLSPEEVEKLRNMEAAGRVDMYDFGAEADVFVDIVTSSDHYAIQQLLNN